MVYREASDNVKESFIVAATVIILASIVGGVGLHGCEETEKTTRARIEKGLEQPCCKERECSR